MTEATAFCPSCGARRVPGGTYCGGCGCSFLDQSAPAFAAPAQPAFAVPGAGAEAVPAGATAPAMTPIVIDLGAWKTSSQPAAGVLAILGGIAGLAACVLPTGMWLGADDATSPFAPLPFLLEDAEIGPGTWFAVEPVAAGLVALVLGLLLLARNMRLGYIGGMLAGIGLMTALNFAAPVIYAAVDGTGDYTNEPGIGGFVGVVAGILMIVAGTIAAAADRRSSW